MAMSNFPRATLVKVLNPAPGNHSGRYLTSVNHQSGRTAISRDIGGLTNREGINEECAWNYRRSHGLGCFDYGSQELIFSRLDIEAICYIHDKSTDGACERWRRVSFHRNEMFRKNAQFCVIIEVVWRLREACEQAVSVFALVVLKFWDGPQTQELMDEFAAASPLAPVLHEGDSPGV